MTTDLYNQLVRPFDVVHKTPNGLDYLTGEQVVSRLNEVLGWNGWAFQVLEHGFDEEADEIWVLGQLSVYLETTIVRQQFGSQKHNRRRESKEILDLGFDLKGAATDALKKCASLIGVGLYLHEKDGGREPAAQRQAPPTKAASRTAPASKPTFFEVTRQLGFKDEHVINEAQSMFNNREPKDLNKDEKMRLYHHLEEARRRETADAGRS